MLSAIWFRRKSEEGSDACNTDCGNRVDLKQRSVTACSTVQTSQVRFHPHAVWSSLARTDSHGFLAPCELVKTNQKFYICSDDTHTHSLAHTSSISSLAHTSSISSSIPSNTSLITHCITHHSLTHSLTHPPTHSLTHSPHTHTRQNWIFEEIHQEVSPVTCNQPRQLDLK